ncbi:MAG: glycoside hydrolase family 9 protein [Bacteroidaceae bacterium]|nr:glycoside hydrolase family 9 protein [Bacteroidaceae bacterium]
MKKSIIGRAVTVMTAGIAVLAVTGCGGTTATDPDLKLNDKEYFEARGVNVLVYSNTFSGGFNDEKNSGIEIIHHGVRTVQGGAVRLCRTPEQWDLVPSTPSRKVDTENGSIEVAMRYPDYDFDSRVTVTAKGKAVEIAVYLDKPVPEELVGNAGFNLEFLPSQYWNKAYIVDGRPCRLPRYAVSETVARPNSEKPLQFRGFRTYDDRGTGEFVDPLPLETGHDILFAPDDPERMIHVTSEDAVLELYDGRILAQNGWFVLRSELPAGKTGKVITWTVEPNQIPGWIREPNIGFSQVGYVPSQPKIAVIELDKMDKPQAKASLIRVMNDGSEKVVFTGSTDIWGEYYKYNYVKFDFSEVREPGVYRIQYGDFKTGNFIIDQSVYDNISDATSDVWIPIHMNHMTVNEGYRIWHGEPFKEGYLQAPESNHFDLHSQGPTTGTKYKPYELIPGLNVGGYFDAGDFDIETGSNISVVRSLIDDWELFHPMRDETFVSEEQRYVDLHRPDGMPDIIQYIRHGVLNLLAQAENIGFMSSALSNSVLDNYHHLGDAAAITDGLHYDPSLPRYVKSKDGKSSGTPDDMWAFTNRNPSQDQNAATMFAAASRVLKEYDPDLAARCMKESKRLSAEASQLMAARQNRGGRQGQQGGQQQNRSGNGNNMATNLQMFISTGESSYKEAFLEQIWPALERSANSNIRTALDAIPFMDSDFREKMKPYVEKYKEYMDNFDTINPYGVPIGEGNWAGSGSVVSFGTTACFANLYFPEIIDRSYAYKAAAFMFGCHPYHNYSLVATVGAARPKQVFYGNNRADFSFIPGNVAPGLLFRKPDHFENYDDWPFLWGQNEGTIAGNCGYLIFSQAFKNMANNE